MEFSEGTRLRRFVRIITIGHDLLARKTSRFRDQPARRRSRTKYRNHCFAITCLHQRRSPLGRFSRDLLCARLDCSDEVVDWLNSCFRRFGEEPDNVECGINL